MASAGKTQLQVYLAEARQELLADAAMDKLEPAQAKAGTQTYKPLTPNKPGVKPLISLACEDRWWRPRLDSNQGPSA